VKRFGLADSLALLMALITFGVIVGVLAQNFLGLQ
jgi:hypothetical protein